MQDNTNPLIEQIRPLLPNEESYGRLHADINDLIEICARFLKVTCPNASQSLSRDELETLLIDLDIEIDHGLFHLKSLKKAINSALEKFAEDGEQSRRGVA